MKFWKRKFGKITLHKLPNKKLLLPVLTILVALVLLTRGQNQEPIQTTTVKLKTITSEISASGSIKSQTSSTLKFPVSGKIAWIGVKEGDYVYKWQAMASLEKEPFLVALRQAQQDVNVADAVLSQVYDEQKKQTAAENFDQKIRRTNAETAKNKAYDTMRKAEFDLAHATIYAPQDGIVTNLAFIVGEQITPTAEIGKIHDLTSLNFVSEIDETDIAKVKIGQKVKILLDAYPEQTVDATIEKVLPVAKTSAGGATVYEVTAPLVGRDTYYIGMNGQTQIITAEKTGALVIPIDAVVKDKYVRVKAGPAFIQKEVKTGIHSDTEVEVTEGLAEGEEIATSGFEQSQRRGLLRRILGR